MLKLANRIWEHVTGCTMLFGGSDVVGGPHDFKDLKALAQWFATTETQDDIHDAAVLVDHRIRRMKRLKKAGDEAGVLALFYAPIEPTESVTEERPAVTPPGASNPAG